MTLLFTLPPLLGIRAIRPARFSAATWQAGRQRPDAAPAARWSAPRSCSAPAAVAATLTEGTLRDSLRTGAHLRARRGHRARAALAGRAGSLCAGSAPFCAVLGPRLPGVAPPRHRQSLPARQSGAGRRGRARRRRDVHPHRLSGAGRAGAIRSAAALRPACPTFSCSIFPGAQRAASAELDPAASPA